MRGGHVGTSTRLTCMRVREADKRALSKARDDRVYRTSTRASERAGRPANGSTSKPVAESAGGRKMGDERYNRVTRDLSLLKQLRLLGCATRREWRGAPIPRGPRLRFTTWKRGSQTGSSEAAREHQPEHQPAHAPTRPAFPFAPTHLRSLPIHDDRKSARGTLEISEFGAGGVPARSLALGGTAVTAATCTQPTPTRQGTRTHPPCSLPTDM